MRTIRPPHPLRACLLATGITLAASASAAVDTADRYIAHLAQSAADVWPVLARETPDMAFYRRLQILASDGQRAWLIDAEGHRAIPFEPVRQLNLPADNGLFNPIEWEGKPTIYLGIQGEADWHARQCNLADTACPVADNFLLATHEAFHFYGQKGWKVPSIVTRGTPYPVLATPRQYRAQLLRRLHEAVAGQPNALGHASYWLQRWKTEFPDEARDGIAADNLEGSAEYVGALAGLIAEGVPRNTPAWRQRLLQQGNPDNYPSDTDDESYPLGVLAGSLLDRHGVAWWPRVATGETPVDILLGTVAPVVDRADTALFDRIGREADDRAVRARYEIEPFLARWRHEASRILVIPENSMKGSFTMSEGGGFFRLRQAPQRLQLRFSATFAPRDGHILASGITVAEVDAAKHCQIDGTTFLAIPLTPQEMARDSDGRLRLRKAGLSVDIPYPAQSTLDPRIYCASACGRSNSLLLSA